LRTTKVKRRPASGLEIEAEYPDPLALPELDNIKDTASTAGKRWF
jgi:hypothetical protein